MIPFAFLRLGISFAELLLLCAVFIVLAMLFSRGGRLVGAITLGIVGCLVLVGVLALGVYSVARVAGDSRLEVHTVDSTQGPWRRQPLGFRHEARKPVVERAWLAPADGPLAPPAPSLEPAADAAATASNAGGVSRPRPEWLEMQPQLDGGVYRLAVASDPRDDVADCFRSLDQKLQEAADNYVARLTSNARANVSLPLSYVLEHVKRDQWQESRPFEFAGETKTMYVVHALLEFDDQDRAHVRALETAALRRERLWHTGLAAGLLLAVLGTAFGYLQLDTLTKGYYSGRLKLAAVAVVAAVAGALWLLAAGPVNVLPGF